MSKVVTLKKEELEALRDILNGSIDSQDDKEGCDIWLKILTKLGFEDDVREWQEDYFE